MSTTGESLKAERLRLGMNQEEFGAAGGVTKRTQISYEQDDRSPDSVYLSAIAAIGADVQFILTGERAATSLTSDENELLNGYRSLDIRGKAGVLGMIDGMSAPTSSAATTATPLSKPERTTHMVFHGKIGQQIHGDITAPQTINVGRKKK